MVKSDDETVPSPDDADVLDAARCALAEMSGMVVGLVAVSRTRLAVAIQDRSTDNANDIIKALDLLGDLLADRRAVDAEDKFPRAEPRGS